MIADAIAQQAAKALSEGSRFQVRQEHIGDEIDVRRLLNQLAVACGQNIRANRSQGLLTLYSDAADESTNITVATVGR